LRHRRWFYEKLNPNFAPEKSALPATQRDTTATMERTGTEIEDFTLSQTETDRGLMVAIIYQGVTYEGMVKNNERDELGSRLITSPVEFVKKCLTTGRPYGVKFYLSKATIYSFTALEEVVRVCCTYTSGEFEFCYEFELVHVWNARAIGI